ncbi:NAD-binding protein [Neisseria chenwenguii]|uniref:NAD-binding protein n=1 Tax=Neisseria chenwenguii TaxID=1853278 RepID=UPI00398A0DF2
MLSAGNESTVEQLKPLFTAFGSQTFYYGEVGKVGGIKLMINALLGIFIQAYGEALLFAEQYGIDKEQVIEMISGSFYEQPDFSGESAHVSAKRICPCVYAQTHDQRFQSGAKRSS